MHPESKEATAFTVSAKSRHQFKVMPRCLASRQIRYREQNSSPADAVINVMQIWSVRGRGEVESAKQCSFNFSGSFSSFASDRREAPQ